MQKNFKQKPNASDEEIQFITQSVDELEPSEKTVIYLFFWRNYSLKEISYVCDLSLSLVQKIFDEAIHRLRLNYLIEFSKPKKSARSYVA